ncbi:ROK family protein [Luteitalea sp.]|uniref:ROK family protein n=1 Tax=Luteitalea sp. TaxID=2004800 RepID=UPI000AD63594|nr:ROK family protein [Luteitalea sp.]
MRIGIDLGGTKIEALALADDGQSLHRERLPTPRHDYEGTLAAIGELVRRCEQATGATGTVGVGMPGAISPATGLVKNANSTWLNGQPFAEDLQNVLARPVRFANDANCLALSEATDGAAAGAEVVFGIILGTGVGGGLVVRGQGIIGANAVGGEWGHNMLPWPEDGEYPGPACYCGLSGCIESWLSGPAFARDFHQRTGREATAAEVLAFATAGDAQAEEAWQRYERRLARALASLINIVDPDVIVAGGGLSNVARLFEHVPQLWDRWVFSDRVDTRLVPAKFGDSSGVRGAAWLWGS